MNFSFSHCATLILAGVLLAGAPLADASAQTATNVKCRGCVGKKDIGKKAVTGRAIKKNAVKTKALRDGAVEEGKLADSAVTAGKIAEGAVTIGKLDASAKPAGAAYTALDDGAIDLSGGEKTIASVDLDAPANGLVIVLAHAFLEFATEDLVICSIGTDEAFDFPSAVQQTGDSTVPDTRASISTSRVFPVSKGPGTYNLVCGTDDSDAVQIRNVKLTALFVSQEY
jgi:hypothetical protein